MGGCFAAHSDQMNGNVVDSPRSLNLQRVCETTDFLDLVCMAKTRNGVFVADCLGSSVSDT